LRGETHSSEDHIKAMIYKFDDQEERTIILNENGSWAIYS
jgi:hypothetical protein